MPEFEIVSFTQSEHLRLNVTNVTGSSTGLLPISCVVTLGFMNADGTTLKTVNRTMYPGQSDFVSINYNEATSVTGGSAQTLHIRPLVFILGGDPTPLAGGASCRFTGFTQVIDTFLGLTKAIAVPAVQASLAQ